MSNKVIRIDRLCSCGCGDSFKCRIKDVKKYIFGHVNIGKPSNARDKKWSSEQRENLSLLRMGHVVSQETKQKISHSQKGKKISEETKIKMSYARLGKLPWNWQGGISKTKEYWKVVSANRYRMTKDLTTKIVQCVYEENIKKYGTLTCYLCLQPIEFGQDHLEHKVPLSRGGSNLRENLDVAHCLCNLKKSNKTEEEYRSICHL